MKDKCFFVCLIVVAAIVVFDQMVKLWASTILTFAPGGVLPFIPGFIGFRYMPNTGAAFSLFSGSTWILGIVSVILGIVVLIFL